MYSRVELVADRSGTGAPVLARMHADGMLAVRRTGPTTVHLVGAAAGPLGGDVVEVHVHVRAGAQLNLRSAAATIALPHRDGGEADVLLDATVEPGGVLDLALEPLLVCRGARLRTRTHLAVQGGGFVRAREQVVLGRVGEEGGAWSGRTVVDADGLPVLRSTLDSAVVAAAGSGVRAIATTVLVGAAAAPYADGPDHPSAGTAVACRLPGGGVLVTALGTDLSAAMADHDAALAAAAASAGQDLTGLLAPQAQQS